GRIGLAELRNLPVTSMVSTVCPPTSTVVGSMLACTVTSSARGTETTVSATPHATAMNAMSLFTAPNLPILARALQLPELRLATLLLQLAFAVLERLQDAHRVFLGKLLELVARKRRHG